MIQENARACRDLLTKATDEVGSVSALARRCGISRRRLHYVLKGHRPIHPNEVRVLRALIAHRV